MRCAVGWTAERLQLTAERWRPRFFTCGHDLARGSRPRSPSVLHAARLHAVHGLPAMPHPCVQKRRLKKKSPQSHR